MYVIESGSKPFCLICHPKTASRSMIEALETLGAKNIDGQHYLNESVCQEILETGIVVSTVRNPWDLMVSWYQYSEHDKKYNGKFPVCRTFLDWLPDWLMNGNGWIERGFYGIDFCNRIMRFEHDLEKQLNNCLQDCGLPSVKLPRIGVTDHMHYSQYYNIPGALAVGREFSNEIEEWGYNFEYES